MTDFAVDTAVSGQDGQYTATLSPAWAFWGPSGGYLAAVALRAAAAHSALPRAASMTVHFLATAKFDSVDLAVRTLRPGQRAESLQVSVSQQGKPVAEALVWLATDDLEGIEHDVAPRPDVPDPEDLPPVEQRLASCSAPPAFLKVAGFLQHIEWRPIEWHDNWHTRPAGEPHWHSWYRYRTQLSARDQIVEAARTLIVLDAMGWASAQAAHPADVGFIAPSLDLNVQFHRTEPDSEWIYAAGTAQLAAEGLVAFRSDVWSRSGRLLTSGSGRQMCRRLPAEALAAAKS